MKDLYQKIMSLFNRLNLQPEFYYREERIQYRMQKEQLLQDYYRRHR